MKKGFITLIVFSVIVLFAVNLKGGKRVSIKENLPDSPPFNVSNAFDGQWEGERVDKSGDDICWQTRIIGTIKDGNVSIRLMYNNTLLKGWISDAGILALYSDSQRWGYRFTGNAVNNHISGKWKVTNAPCHGTWYIEKQ